MWVLYTYLGGDIVQTILTGIAAITADDSYIEALRIAALFGFLGVLISAALRSDRLNLKWFLSILLVYFTTIVPTVDVTVEDRIASNRGGDVNDVPLGIAVTGSIFSQLSDWIMNGLETAFNLPDIMKYQENGMLFAHKLIHKSTHFSVISQRMKSNLSNFWENCVHYDILSGRISSTDLLNSNDLEVFLTDLSSQIQRFSYKNDRRDQNFLSCQNGFALIIGDFTNEINIINNYYAPRLIPYTTTADAVSELQTGLQETYLYFTDINLPFRRIILQNILASSLRSSLEQLSPHPASEIGQTSPARFHESDSSRVIGYLSGNFLPVFKSTMEGAIYALFPIIILIALSTSVSRILGLYVKVLFWISLWEPLYAILHFATSLYTKDSTLAAILQPGLTFSSGISLSTLANLQQVLANHLRIGHLLSLSIPILSWICVHTTGNLATHLIDFFGVNSRGAYRKNDSKYRQQSNIAATPRKQQSHREMNTFSHESVNKMTPNSSFSHMSENQGNRNPGWQINSNAETDAHLTVQSKIESLGQNIAGLSSQLTPDHTVIGSKLSTLAGLNGKKNRKRLIQGKEEIQKMPGSTLGSFFIQGNSRIDGNEESFLEWAKVSKKLPGGYLETIINDAKLGNKDSTKQLHRLKNEYQNASHAQRVDWHQNDTNQTKISKLNI